MWLWTSALATDAPDDPTERTAAGLWKFDADEGAGEALTKSARAVTSVRPDPLLQGIQPPRFSGLPRTVNLEAASCDRLPGTGGFETIASNDPQSQHQKRAHRDSSAGLELLSLVANSNLTQISQNLKCSQFSANMI